MRKITVIIISLISTIIIIAIGITIVGYFHWNAYKTAILKKIDECDKLVKLAAEEEEKLDLSRRFLRTPNEYIELADRCEKSLKCVNGIENHAVSQKLFDLIKPCSFYVYYARDFQTCANKLIARKDDIDCLNILFNDNSDPDVDECKQFDEIQPCIKAQIRNICGDVMGERYGGTTNIREGGVQMEECGLYE